MKRILTLVVAVAMLAAFTIPASAELKISGEWRLRAEQRNNTNFSDDGTASPNSVDDDIAFYGQRARLNLDATPTDDVAVRIVLQGTWNWGSVEAANGGPALSPSTNVGIHEANLTLKQFFGTPLDVKLGRQELNYGDQRLIGSFGWSNNGRSFDATKVTYANDAVNVDLIDAKILDRNVTAGDMNNDRELYGIYATIKSVPNNAIDLYVLQLNDGNRYTNFWLGDLLVDYNATGGNTDILKQEIMTYGFRVAGNAGPVDYGLEMPFQTGSVDWARTNGLTGTVDVSASAIAAKAGFTLPGENKLRIGVEYDQASGTGANAQDFETFTNLYPTNHVHYGYMDLMAWRNMNAINVNVSGNVNDSLSARVDYWMFALEESTADGWYKASDTNTSVGATFCPLAKCKDDVGDEIDITVKYKYNSAVDIQAGISRFMPGGFVKDVLSVGTAKPEDQDWMYLQILGKF